MGVGVLSPGHPGERGPFGSQLALIPLRHTSQGWNCFIFIFGWFLASVQKYNQFLYIYLVSQNVAESVFKFGFFFYWVS